ncbi:fungal fruit body lectin [Aspergillus keveii]|uniref:Fungal fruit body lectin n=1 Tax=Aspergillus keveii TaxID=714993 RepID=A0ABR4FKU1_9EURO
MSAEIDLTVNSHRGSLDVIEKTVWHEESGGEWAEAGGKHVLTIGTRGAGLIRFREHNGQVFSVVIGIGYGEKPWADVQVDLGRADTGTKLLPEYYSGRLSNEGHILVV